MYCITVFLGCFVRSSNIYIAVFISVSAAVVFTYTTSVTPLYYTLRSAHY